MKLKLSKMLYRWLVNTKVIKLPVKEQQEDYLTISFDEQIYFENGYKIGKILRQVDKDTQAGLKNLGKIRKITVLKDYQNWDIIWRALKVLGIKYNSEYESSNVSDNNDIINNILVKIYKKYYEQAYLKKSKYAVQGFDEFSLELFDKNKKPDETNNTLEFICLTLSNIFALPINEIIGMIINKSQILAHLIVQGQAVTEFENIKKLYDFLITNSDHFRTLLSKEKENIRYIMSSLRCGLFSSSKDISIKCIELIKLLEIKDWIIKSGDGYRSIFLGLKRHPNLSQTFFDFIMTTMAQEFINFLKNQFKYKFFSQSDFIYFCSELIKYMKSSLYRREFIEAKVPEDWLDICFQTLDELDSEGGNTNMRIKCLNLITEVMLMQDYTSRPRYTNKLKAAYTPKEYVHAPFSERINYLNCLFRLLVNCAQKRSAQSKVYYEYICMNLESNYQTLEIREFIVENMRFVFERFDKLPLNIFLDALKDTLLNQSFDFEMLDSMVRLKTQTKETCLLIAELSMTNYQHNIYNYSFSDIVVFVIEKFREEVEEFAVKCIKILLSLYYAFVNNAVNKSKRAVNLTSKQTGAKKVTKIYYTKSEETELIREKQKSNNLTFLRRIINLKCKPILHAVKPFVVSTRNQLKKNKKPVDTMDKFIQLIQELSQEEVQSLKFSDGEQEELPTQLEVIPEEKQVLKPRSTSILKKLKKLSRDISASEFDDPELHPYTEEQVQTEQTHMLNAEVLENHEIAYMKYIQERYEKVFNQLYEKFKKLGIDKFIREYNLQAFPIQQLYHSQENQLINLKTFTDLLMQAGMHSQHNIELVEAKHIDRIIDHFKNEFQRRAESTILFEDIDDYYMQHSDKVQMYTKQIETNKQFVLPEEFKICLTKKINFDHNIIEKMSIDDKWLISYSIICELLKHQFDLTLVEPVVLVENKLRVRPKVFDKLKKLDTKRVAADTSNISPLSQMSSERRERTSDINNATSDQHSTESKKRKPAMFSRKLKTTQELDPSEYLEKSKNSVDADLKIKLKLASRRKALEEASDKKQKSKSIEGPIDSIQKSKSKTIEGESMPLTQSNGESVPVTQPNKAEQ